MGCSCNKTVNKTTSQAAKRQISKPRTIRNIGTSNTNKNVVRRILNRY